MYKEVCYKGTVTLARIVQEPPWMTSFLLVILVYIQRTILGQVESTFHSFCKLLQTPLLVTQNVHEGKGCDPFLKLAMVS